jgi:HK97 family phage prohead protease
MGKKIRYDFGGYATKNGLRCSDGRTILKDAFKHNDGQTVPLVWQHLHNEPSNILGHAVLENRDDGVYAYGKFNNTEAAKNAKQLVEHGDITALSIYANDLKQNGKDVIHGTIREVSLVLAGANPGALIDNLNIVHSDGTCTEDDTEVIIYTGLKIVHGEIVNNNSSMNHSANDNEETLADIFNTFSEKQKNVVYALIAHALSKGEDNDVEHTNINSKGEGVMKKNIFDKEYRGVDERPKLTHDQLKAIMEDAKKCGSFKEAFLAHTTTYGIENIDYLFPDAKTIMESPDFVKRQTEWVAGVINGAKHSPFSRIKTLAADLTLDTARAKGYVKGNLKKEEFFSLSKRITTPTTIYKKQKLDRDDIIDITDLDVVAWLKMEMRFMLDEELARAVLIGDGREADDPDKINETNIRPIAKDNEFFAHPIQVAANTSGATLIESIIRARPYYKGSGNPSLYTTEAILTDMLLVKDKIGRRLYPTMADLVSALRVKEIIPVEAMEGYSADNGDLVGILVNMKDYCIGADKGGQVSMFDDFDIDYNQYKYLIETRCSGALTKPKSALVFWRATGTLAIPEAPTFVSETNTLTIPSVIGVLYTIDDEVVSPGNIIIVEDTFVDAVPAEGYYFAPNTISEWFYSYNPEGE